MYRNDRLPGCFVVILAVAVAVACTATPQQIAHRTVTAIGVALDVTDAATAQAYADRAHAALAASSDMASYRAAMAPMDDVERGLRVAHSALELGDAAILVWDRGGVTQWSQALPCIVGALVGLRDLLVAADVPIPAELSALLDGVHSVTDTDLCFGGA